MATPCIFEKIKARENAGKKKKEKKKEKRKRRKKEKHTQSVQSFSEESTVATCFSLAPLWVEVRSLGCIAAARERQTMTRRSTALRAMVKEKERMEEKNKWGKNRGGERKRWGGREKQNGAAPLAERGKTRFGVAFFG